MAALWRYPLGLLLTVVPPLGLIGWASPTAAAGLLFPATGYAGFAFTLCIPGLILRGQKLGLAGVAAGILLAHLLSGPLPQLPSGWEAIDTSFGPISHAQVSLLREYEIEQQIQIRAIHSRARVVIFPEAVVPKWTAATDLFWSDTTSVLRKAGKVILVGALKPNVHREAFDFRATLAALQSSATSPEPIAEPVIAETPTYENEVMIRGAQTGEFVERVPVPIGMWKPFTGRGVPLSLDNPGTVSIAGRRTAVIICYEQLIPWPVLASFIERPSIIVAISNNVWVAGTPIPRIEQTTMSAWAALFHVPILSAENT